MAHQHQFPKRRGPTADWSNQKWLLSCRIFQWTFGTLRAFAAGTLWRWKDGQMMWSDWIRMLSLPTPARPVFCHGRSPPLGSINQAAHLWKHCNHCKRVSLLISRLTTKTLTKGSRSQWDCFLGFVCPNWDRSFWIPAPRSMWLLLSAWVPKCQCKDPGTNTLYFLLSVVSYFLALNHSESTCLKWWALGSSWPNIHI